MRKALKLYNGNRQYPLNAAAEKAGASKSVVKKWARGDHCYPGRGRPQSNTGAELAAVARCIRTQQKQRGTGSAQSDFGKLAAAADENGRPYRGGAVSKPQRAALEKRMATLGGQAPDEEAGEAGEVRRGKSAKKATRTRQSAVSQVAPRAFALFVGAEYQGMPHLTAEDIWGYDESQLTTNGEKLHGLPVHYDVMIRARMGEPRSSAMDKGGNRTSLLFAFNAAGDHLYPGFYFKGQLVQPGWAAGPCPRGVNKEYVRRCTLPLHPLALRPRLPTGVRSSTAPPPRFASAGLWGGARGAGVTDRLLRPAWC